MPDQWNNQRANEVTAGNILCFRKGQMVRIVQMCTGEIALWAQVYLYEKSIPDLTTA